MQRTIFASVNKIIYFVQNKQKYNNIKSNYTIQTIKKKKNRK